MKEFHRWAHRQLVDLVEYKAEADGISVGFVDSKNTSRRCPECGHTSEGTECDRRSLSVSPAVRLRMQITSVRRMLGGGLSVGAYSRLGGRATVNSP